MANRFGIVLVAVSAAFIGGCAVPSKESAFQDVQQTTSDRLGRQIRWNQNSQDDRSVESAVRNQLAHELFADAAVQIALVNNRNLQATFEDLGVAQADLVQAGLLKNPVFTLGVRFPDRSPKKTYLDFSVEESFIDVFFIPARKRIAAAALEQAKAKVTNEVLELAAKTRIAFYRLQAAEQVVTLREQAAQAASAAAETSTRLHTAGNINDLDLANANAQLARASLDVEDAKSAAADAREELNSSMGLWGGSIHWTASKDFEPITSSSIAADDLEHLAIRQREDLIAAREEINIQAQSLGLTKSSRYIGDATIGPEAERETEGQWRIGPALSLPIPLFDQGQAKVSKSIAMLRQSLDRYWAKSIEIRAQVRAAQARMLHAANKARLYHDQVLPAQKQIVHQSQLQYNGMLVGVFELLQVRRDEIDLTRSYIEAQRDYWISRAELERAIGGRLPTPFATTQPGVNP